MQCQPCKGTGISPSTPNKPCLCCKGKREISQDHYDALKRVSNDIKTKLEQKEKNKMNSQPIKTDNAKRVLQLMDSCEGGGDRYGEFVKQVSQEQDISIEQLEKELDPFI